MRQVEKYLLKIALLLGIFIMPFAASAEEVDMGEKVSKFLNDTGFAQLFAGNWLCLVMIVVACVLFYLAIVKKFEPLLLLPIAFGMLLTNLPGAGLFHPELFDGGHVHWEAFTNANNIGLLDYLYLGVKLGIYPCIIFIGVGAMTDFGPLLANPKSFLLGSSRPTRNLRYVLGSPCIRLYLCRGRIYRNYRRCRRANCDLLDIQASTGITWSHCRGCLLVHGTGSCDTATYHESVNNPERTGDCNETIA